MVYANINNQEDDFSFLLTALYHWEEANPRFSHKLPKTFEDYKKFEEKRKRSHRDKKRHAQEHLAAQELIEKSKKHSIAASYYHHHRGAPPPHHFNKKPIGKSAGINGLQALDKMFEEIIKNT